MCIEHHNLNAVMNMKALFSILLFSVFALASQTSEAYWDTTPLTVAYGGRPAAIDDGQEKTDG